MVTETRHSLTDLPEEKLIEEALGPPYCPLTPDLTPHLDALAELAHRRAVSALIKVLDDCHWGPIADKALSFILKMASADELEDTLALVQNTCAQYGGLGNYARRDRIIHCMTENNRDHPT
jgi:hypothetical protein